MTEVHKVRKCRYTASEAMEYILAPGSDSELSDLESDSDDDNDFTVEKNVDAESESESDTTDTENSEEKSDATKEKPNNGTIPSSDASTSKDKRSFSNKNEHKFRWRSKEPPIINYTFRGDKFSPPPETFDKMLPTDFLKIFWTDITNMIAEQTNLYSVQNKGSSIETNPKEIEQFLGMHILMGVIKLPDYDMYWAVETRYPKTVDIMSNNRYKLLRRYIHVADNTKKDEEANKNDKIFKIRPVIEAVRDNCQKIEPEPIHSTDEQIIPAKTKHSGIRQYNPQKPKKWGFKIFVRAGQSGIMYDFFLYKGKDNVRNENCSAENVVLRLLEGLPQQKKL